MSAGFKTGLNGGKLGNPAVYLMHSYIMKSRVSLALKPDSGKPSTETRSTTK